MSEKFKISIDDVQEFLIEFKGWVWDKKIVTMNGKVPATQLSDLELKHNTPAEIYTVDMFRNHDSIHISVDPISFLTYESSLDLYDIDALIEFAIEDDFSDQWINFLAKKYGEEYGSYATGLCEKQRLLIINKSAERLEEVKLIEKMIWDNHKKDMKNCSDIQNKINSAIQNANNSNLGKK